MTSLRHPTAPATIPAASVSGRRLSSQIRSVPALGVGPGAWNRISDVVDGLAAERFGEGASKAVPVGLDDRRHQRLQVGTRCRRCLGMRSFVNAT